MNSTASQQGELQELATRMSTGPVQGKLPALARVAALDSQGVDCQNVFPIIHNVPDPSSKEYIRGRRYVGILSENYLENFQNISSTVLNGICQDFEKPDPQIKGIAVRHAGKLTTDETADRLVPIILNGAKHDDPYVRKAAALAILNLSQTKASYIDRFKLGPVLRNLVEDSNPNVAANSVAALTEINSSRVEPLFTPTSSTINNLLAAIDQATEWAQVEILDFVSTYKPTDGSDARGIIARVQSRLSHANSAVVLSAIRCCLQMNMFVDDQARVRDNLTKVVQPLVTLLNGTAPIQYVAIKSILVLLQHYKRMLSSEVNLFFCKFDDPLYMKMTKLDVILTLSTNQNVGKVLEVLYDYARQTDVEFVRKSIRSIGKIAVQFEAAAKSCVDKLVSLIDMKLQFVVQECIIVAVDIFRRYPGKYESIIGNICNNLQGLDDHRARAAMAWILGQYASSISNADELISMLFMDDFVEDTPDSQLSIMTAVIKLYLERPEDGQDLLQRVIQMATNEVENPDVRDRAYMYLWMMQNVENPDNYIFPAESPNLVVDMFSMNPNLVKQLVPQVGTLAVLYNKPPQEFVQTTKFISIASVLHDGEDGGMKQGETSIEQMELPILVDSRDPSAYGIEIRGLLQRIGEQNSFVLRFTNFSEQPLEMKQIAFNRNIFGFAQGEMTQIPPSVAPQKSATISVPVIFSEEHLQNAIPSPVIDIAVLVNRDTPIYFHCPASLSLILVSAEQGAKMTKQTFMQTWQDISEDNEVSGWVQNARIDSVDVAKHQMATNRLYFAAKKANCGFFSGKTIKGDVLIVYLIFQENNSCQIGVRMYNRDVAQVILELVKAAIQ